MLKKFPFIFLKNVLVFFTTGRNLQKYYIGKAILDWGYFIKLSWAQFIHKLKQFFIYK